MADLAAEPKSIQSVYSWYRENRLFVNRRYQRKLVWTLEEKQKLIDSILKKYPIPAILIAEKEDAPGTYEIIDGLQRLHAILSFIETSFPTLDGRLFNLEHFPTAKGFADAGDFVPTIEGELLTQKEVSTILDYTLALSVMRNATEDEVNDVFDRINTYGHRLSDQERRQAGVQNDFSSMVREIACNLRGDVSAEILPLYSMPSISIDLPKTKHGYSVRADEVFWVEQGVLRSTDLRDSMDEQCIADIAASLVGGAVIERSKDALDEIYLQGSAEAERISTALGLYGPEKFSDEFNYCVQEIIKICNAGKPSKLRDILFEKTTTNPFPSVFAVIMIAFHQLIITDSMTVSDFEGTKKALTNLSIRIEMSRRATSPEERRKNVDTIKGLVVSSFVKSNDAATEIYGNHTVVDVESVIRRSEIELANYELKQGLLNLKAGGGVNEEVITKVVNTICAIANNGPETHGKILIGVTDKESDAARAVQIDKIAPRIVGKRSVVGVNREAARLGISLEKYFSIWKDGIRNSKLSEKLKGDVLSKMDFNSYYDLGLIVISVPPQAELSYVGDYVFWREGDSTILAESAKDVAMLAKRF